MDNCLSYVYFILLSSTTARGFDSIPEQFRTDCGRFGICDSRHEYCDQVVLICENCDVICSPANARDENSALCEQICPLYAHYLTTTTATPAPRFIARSQLAPEPIKAESVTNDPLFIALITCTGLVLVTIVTASILLYCGLRASRRPHNDTEEGVDATVTEAATCLLQRPVKCPTSETSLTRSTEIPSSSTSLTS